MDEQNIFISYSRKDKDTVESIVSRIESELQKKDCCWIDVDGIESGQMFWDIIIKAVKKCSAFLLMASDNSMSSNNVLGEIQIAKNNSKNIVPVIIDKDVLKNDRFLAHFPVNNYILADNPDHMSRLIHDLKNWCRLELSEHESVKVEVKSLSADVCLKVLSNLDCKVLIDCEEKAVALADRLTKISLPVGEYYAEFISTENPADAISREIILEHDKFEKVDLLSLKQTRLESMSLVPYITNNRVGFADIETREIIIPCKYDSAKSFSEGLACVKMNGKWGYIDMMGGDVIECMYDEAYNFSDGLARVQVNGKYGYVDRSGREVISSMYTILNFLREGLVCVKVGGKWGSLDKSGREVIPCRYDYQYAFFDGLAGVKINGKWGYIDKSGREALPFIYDLAGAFVEDGLACVRKQAKYGFIDRSGREIIPVRYDDALSFSEGLACVRINDKYGYIDKSGREVIPCRYDIRSYFHNGLATVKINGKYGYIDKSGQEVVPCLYDDAFAFHDGFALVKMKGRYGYIDNSGREVIPCIYDYAWDFNDGLASVTKNGKKGHIDRFGNEMWLEK